jgi:serpin B
MLKFLMIAFILASFLAACGQAPTPTGTELPEPTKGAGQTSEAMPDSQLVMADVPRVASGDASQEQLQELVRGNNVFAFDLYHRVTEGSNENLIYSPYSISLAFSMLYAGAAGETQAQMREALNYLAQEAQHPAFNALDQQLASLGDESGGETEGEAFQLNIANAVWGQQGLPFNEPYLNILAGQYGAGLRVVDFAQDPEAARQLVNDWVAEQTEERIRDILPQGAIDASTRLVLANAIYFKAGWLFPFDPAATQEGPFELLDGAETSVPMMHLNTVRAPYYQGNGYQAVLLPYSGERVDMLVILPERGQFESVEEALSPDLLDQVRGQAEIHDVTLSMPKFDFETDINLPDLLKEMGMTDPFSPGAADFSGIVEDGGLYVSAAVHKGTIKVDELGTEAAAATVIAMAESAMPRAEMSLVRPFIFAILERETGTILFLGRVMDPMG